MKKKIVSVLVLIIICLSFSYAQNKKSSTKVPAVSSEERASSVTFANGLKAFYSQDFAGAEKEFLKVIASRPNNAPAYYMMGKVKSEQRDYAASEFYLTKAVNLDKKNIWYLVALADVLDDQGNYEKSVPVWSKICAAEPRNEYYLFYYADACFHTGNYKQVITLYDKMEQVMGVSEELTSAKVELWLHLDDVKSAVGEYDKLIKMDPNNEEYYIRAAEIYLTNQMSEKAMPYFEKMLKINPNNPEAQFVMASYYEQKGDASAAFSSWLFSFKSPDIPLDRKLPVMRRYLASLATSAPTKEQYELSAALTEAHPEAVEGWAALGSLSLKEKKYAAAANYFEKAIAIDLSQYALWQDYLYCLAQSREYDKIISKEADILELFPTNSMIYFTFGVAYLNTSRAEKSLSYFEKAIEYSYDNAEKKRIYGMMANAYHELGNASKEAEFRAKAER